MKRTRKTSQMARVPPVRKTWSHCPRCGAAAAKKGGQPFRCSACGYTHYFGPVTAVGCIALVPDGRMLLLIRGKDPGKGLYGVPGGFVDPGESAEQAVRREVMEEIGLKVLSCRYLTSFPNEYVYCGAALPVTDLFFVIELPDPKDIITQEGEVEGWHLCYPGERELSKMAFRSNRRALEFYLKQKKKIDRKKTSP